MTKSEFLKLSPSDRALWIHQSSDAEVRALRDALNAPDVLDPMVCLGPGVFVPRAPAEPIHGDHPAYLDAVRAAEQLHAADNQAAADRARDAHHREYLQRKAGDAS